MCRRITCEQCGKPSFAGCGLHIESVLKDVPVAERCQGHARDAAPGTADTSKPGGVLGAIKDAFGRRG